MNNFTRNFIFCMIYFAQSLGLNMIKSTWKMRRVCCCLCLSVVSLFLCAYFLDYTTIKFHNMRACIQLEYSLKKTLSFYLINLHKFEKWILSLYILYWLLSYKIYSTIQKYKATYGLGSSNIFYTMYYKRYSRRLKVCSRP